MKNSDTFYRIRIVLLTWLKLPILIQLYPSRDFLYPLSQFLYPYIFVALLSKVSNRIVNVLM